MTPEASLPSAPDVIGSSDPAASSPATPETGTSSADVNTQSSVQSQTETPTLSQDAEFKDIPSSDELKALVEQNVPHAKAVAQLRSALEAIKPQFAEMQERYRPFEPLLERFEKPESLQEALSFHDKLFGAYERVDGHLVPATQTFAQEVAQRDPLVADYLAADLMNMETTDPETGRTLPRMELALELMKSDPARRANALRILGGVEPTSIAPTWQPSAEELEVVKPELQDIYRQLPYDEREELKANSPDFINRQLEKEKFQQDLIAQNKTAQEREQRETQRREQYMVEKAQEAANTYVEQGFRQGMTEFATSIVERTQFIAPLDPQSPEAQSMAPEQVAQFNQKAQQINTGVGKFIAVVSAAMAVPDTQWMAVDFLKELGLDANVIQKFDESRQAYARNARDYGELNFQMTAGQGNGANGNGQPSHLGLGTMQSNASQAMKSLKGYANLVAQPLQKLLSDFFEMKAGSYNQTLNGGAVARPSANGSHYDPATAPAQRPQGWMSREEIERQYS